jgi:serine protease inhibitor
MKPIFAFLLIISLTLTTACGAELTKPKPKSNSEEKKDGAMINQEQSPDVVNSRMNFAFSLYPPVIQDQAPHTNILLSPVSIMLALMMAYNGSDGETQAAMESTLESSGISLEALNHENQTWIQAMEKSDEHVQLQIANSMWGRDGISFEDTFVDNIKDYYSAEVQSLDFDQPEASDTINQWVSDQTNDKIKQIVGKSINPDTILFLINAIYFNGKWEQPFDPKLTNDDTFNLTDSATKQHPFMNQSGSFKYLQEDAFQAVQLPYGDGSTSMYAFLPNVSSSLQEFQEQLTADHWSTWLSSFRDRKGAVSLPKFKLEYEIELKKVLSAMGMGIAFKEGQADFTRMVVDKSSTPFISSVKHKTYIDVHEEGTEAAAVTSIEVSVTSLNTNEPEPFEMKIDRPFFIVITDNQTGAILFMGSIYDPQL